MGRLAARAVVMAGLMAAGCASIRHDAPKLTPEPCATDAAVLGTWTDFRMTQLGPAWMKVSFEADCTFSMRGQLLFFRVTERGQYRAGAGRIQFERTTAPTSWPYRLLDAGSLEVTEYPGEVYVYRK